MQKKWSEGSIWWQSVKSLFIKASYLHGHFHHTLRENEVIWERKLHLTHHFMLMEEPVLYGSILTTFLMKMHVFRIIPLKEKEKDDSGQSNEKNFNGACSSLNKNFMIRGKTKNVFVYSAAIVPAIAIPTLFTITVRTTYNAYRYMHKRKCIIIKLLCTADCRNRNWLGFYVR